MITVVILILVLVIIGFGVGFGFLLGFARGFERGAREAVPEYKDKRRKGFGWSATVVGGAFLLVAMVSCFYTMHFVQAAVRAEGMVTEMVSETGKDGDKSYAPTFRFHDASGAEYTVSSRMYQSPPEFQVGEAVKILYLPNNPKNARIDGFWQVWGLPVIMGMSGGLTLLIGVMVLLWPQWRDRKKSPA